MRLCVKNKKTFFILLGYGIGLGSFLVMSVTFFIAFFNSGFKATIHINKFGEAYFEALFFIPVCFLFLVYGFYLFYHKEVAGGML